MALDESTELRRTVDLLAQGLMKAAGVEGSGERVGRTVAGEFVADEVCGE